MIIYQMRSRFCVFSEGWAGCEGLAHKAIQPWMNEHEAKAVTVRLWEVWPVCVCHTACPRAGEAARLVCARE